MDLLGEVSAAWSGLLAARCRGKTISLTKAYRFRFMPAVVSGRSHGRVNMYARAPESYVLARSRKAMSTCARRTTARLEGCQGLRCGQPVAEVILHPINKLGARSLFRLALGSHGHYAVSGHVRAVDSADAVDAMDILAACGYSRYTVAYIYCRIVASTVDRDAEKVVNEEEETS